MQGIHCKWKRKCYAAVLQISVLIRNWSPMFVLFANFRVDWNQSIYTKMAPWTILIFLETRTKCSPCDSLLREHLCHTFYIKAGLNVYSKVHQKTSYLSHSLKKKKKISYRGIFACPKRNAFAQEFPWGHFQISPVYLPQDPSLLTKFISAFCCSKQFALENFCWRADALDVAFHAGAQWKTEKDGNWKIKANFFLYQTVHPSLATRCQKITINMPISFLIDSWRGCWSQSKLSWLSSSEHKPWWEAEVCLLPPHQTGRGIPGGEWGPSQIHPW